MFLNGIMELSFFSRVTAPAYSEYISSSAFAEFRSFVSPFKSTFELSLSCMRVYLNRSTFLTAFSSLSSDKVPSATASSISAMLLAMLRGLSNMSFPASRALRACLSALAPFISNASVNTRPLNPIPFFSKVSTTSGDSDVGIPSAGSRAGICK